MIDDIRRDLLVELEGFADRIGDGDLTERHPLEFVVKGESLSARVYQRFNGTPVLVLDAFVDNVPVSAAITRWVATRSAKMPFATIHLDRERGVRNIGAVLVSHTMFAETVTTEELAEVIDAITWMARKARRSLDEIVSEEGIVIADDFGLGADPDDDEDDVDGFGEDVADAGSDVDPDAPPIVVIDAPVADAPGAGEPVEGSPEGALLEARVPRSGPSKQSAPARELPEILADLDRLVGLGGAKKAIHSLVHSHQINAERRRKGLAVVETSPHLVFVGNPGTGKTTVARLVGELYRSLGLLPSGHLVEVGRADLVAAYVGQTAIKTTKACEQALGGVLFIDEAYSLANGRDEFGFEAINTLVAFMENHRGEFAVVVAGYPVEMRKFLEANAGLRSRFDITVKFADYDSTELLEIFENLVAANDYELDPDAALRLRKLLASWPRHRGFGNAREVRKLFHEVVRRQAKLVAGESRYGTDLLKRIPADAIPPPSTRKASNLPPRNAGYL